MEDTAAEKELLRKKINEGTATDEEIIRYKDELGGSLGPKGTAAYNAAKGKTNLTEAHTFQTVDEGAKLGDTNITVGKNGSLPNGLNVNDYNKEALQQEIANKSPEDLADEQNNGNPIDVNATPTKQLAAEYKQDAEREKLADTPDLTELDSKPSIEELRKQYANDNEGYKKALQKYGYDMKDNSPYKPMSIQDAYYKGLLDKGSRDYMMADTLANFGRNLGKDIGNVGAQFSGGTIDNNYDEGLWNQRNKAMVETGVNSEQNKVSGSNENLNYQQAVETIKNSSLTNEQKNKQLSAARVIQGAMEEAIKNGNQTQANLLAGVLTNVANGYADEATFIALGLDGIGKDSNIVNIITNPTDARVKDTIERNQTLGLTAKSSGWTTSGIADDYLTNHPDTIWSHREMQNFLASTDLLNKLTKEQFVEFAEQVDRMKAEGIYKAEDREKLLNELFTKWNVAR